jgi:hypothetical protein
MEVSGMELQGKDAVPMIGAYLDGELSESRAGLVRQHLLACHTCRNGARDGKALKRWFAPLREAADAAGGAPAGFAARVARRAFAGDRGSAAGAEPFPARAGESRGVRFVLSLTAVAAAAALLLALGLRMQGRPDGGRLSADDRTLLPLSQVRRELEELNRAAPPPPRPADATRPADPLLPPPPEAPAQEPARR